MVPGPGSQIDCFHICIQEEADGPIVSKEIVSGVPIGQGALLCHTRGPGQPSGLRRTHLGTGTGHICSRNLVSLELCLLMAMNQCNRQKPEIVSYLTAAGNKTGSSSTNSNANTLDQFLEQGKTNLIDSYYLTLSLK